MLDRGAGRKRPAEEGRYENYSGRVIVDVASHCPPALLPALQAAVPMWIDLLRATDPWQRVALAKEDAAEVAAHGDVLMYRGGKRGDTARVFNALARGLAIAAYQPGGVTFAGLRWDADDPRDQDPPPSAARGRAVVDVHLPGQAPRVS